MLDTLGNLLLMHGDTEEGFGMLRQATEQLPTDAEIQLHLGRALAQHDRHDEAQAVLSRLIENTPNGDQANEAKRLLTGMAANKPQAE